MTTISTVMIVSSLLLRPTSCVVLLASVDASPSLARLRPPFM